MLLASACLPLNVGFGRKERETKGYPEKLGRNKILICEKAMVSPGLTYLFIYLPPVPPTSQQERV